MTITKDDVEFTKNHIAGNKPGWWKMRTDESVLLHPQMRKAMSTGNSIADNCTTHFYGFKIELVSFIKECDVYFVPSAVVPVLRDVAYHFGDGAAFELLDDNIEKLDVAFEDQP